MTWVVYLLECRDGSVYTGVAVDVASRFRAHADGRGARYTRARPPRRLLAVFPHPDRAAAQRAEAAIKRLSPATKRALAADPEGARRAREAMRALHDAAPPRRISTGATAGRPRAARRPAPESEAWERRGPAAAATARARAPRFVARRSAIHGRGVFATRDLPAGERLLEYRGRRISHAEANRRYGDGLDGRHTFLFTLNAQWLIDGADGGNAARWINHGCEPNCEATIEVDRDGDARRDRVVLRTRRAVRAGEELTFDYALRLPVPHDARRRALFPCRCGARSCRGTLLAPSPRSRTPTARRR